MRKLIKTSVAHNMTSNTDFYLEDSSQAEHFSKNYPNYLCAIEHFFRGSLDQAIISAQLQIIEDPHHIDSHILYIQCAMRLGKEIQAKDAFITFFKMIDHSQIGRNDSKSFAIMAYNCAEYEKAKEIITRYHDLNNFDPELLNIEGCIFLKENNPIAALKSFKSELSLDPSNARTHYNISVALRQLRSIKLALHHLERAAFLNPRDYTDLTGLYYCSSRLMDFTKKEKFGSELLSHLSGTSEIRDPLPLLLLTDDGDFLRDAHKKYSQRYNVSQVSHAPRDIKKRVRIGYVSSDFTAHATSFLIEELIQIHSRDKFEVIGFDFSKETYSSYQRKIQNLFDLRVDLSKLHDSEAAKTIRDHEIDILIDLKGYTEGARFGIFARRPCERQVTYLGYPGTSGSDAIDYIIGDSIVTPEKYSHYYCENIVELDCCYQPNTKNKIIGNDSTLEDHGLPQGALIFCSFNNQKKLNINILETWGRILQRSKNSILWLLGSYNDSVIIDYFNNTGISSNRIIFASRTPPELHLERLRHASVFLDSFPYGAHTTASDALFWGVPVITMQGRAFQSRVASSIMHYAGGGSKCIATSLGEYEDLAVGLYNDKDGLLALRKILIDKSSPKSPYNTMELRNQIEASFLAMIQMDKPNRIKI